MAGVARSALARPFGRYPTLRHRWVHAAIVGLLASSTALMAVPTPNEALALTTPPPFDWAVKTGPSGPLAVAPDGAAVIAHAGTVARYTATGVRAWSNVQEGTARDIAVDSTGDVVVVGWHAGTTTFGSGASTVVLTTPKDEFGDDEWHGFIAKYSSTGALRWAISQGADGEHPVVVAVTETDEIVVCGRFFDGITLGSGSSTVTLTDQVGSYVAAYTPTGQISRAVSVTLGSYHAADMAIGQNGDVVLVGSYSEKTQRRDFFPPYLTWYSGWTNMYVKVLDIDGAERWDRTFRLDSYSSSTFPREPVGSVAGVVVDASGNIGIAGGYNADDPQFQKPFGSASDRSFTNLDVFVASYSTSGTLRWSQRAGGAITRIDDRVTGIAVDRDGSLFVTGTIFSGDAVTFGTGVDQATLPAIADREHAFLAAYGSSGALRWAIRGPLQGVNWPIPRPLIGVDRSGGVLLAANFASSVTVGNGSSQITLTATTDGYLARYGAAPSVSAEYVALSPARLLDTRPEGVTVDGAFQRIGIRPAGSTLQLQLTGREGVPTTAAAVVLNVTATQAAANGYVTVFPCGTTQPYASNLNVQPGVAVPNLVIAKVGTGGKVCLYTHAAMHLIADANGYVPAGSPYAALVPARLLDTRPEGLTVDGGFQRIGIRAAGSTLELRVTGRGGVPGDAKAVVLNVTATQALGDGYVTVFPCGTSRPNASNVNYRAGVAVPNAVVSKVGAGGKVCLYSHEATQLIVDVNGYHPPASAYSALSPARLLDTRPDGLTVDGTFQRTGIRAAGSTLELRVTGRGGVPATVSAVVLNVTATQAVANGYVTVFPCGTTRPNASNVNFRPGIAIPNAAIAEVGTGGKVCLYTHEATQLIIDVNGYQP